MLGRFIAILIAIFLMIMLPLKYRGVTEAKRTENITGYLIESFIQDLEDNRKLKLDKLYELRNKMFDLGHGYSLELEIGTVLYYQGSNTIDVIYTDEIIEQLEKSPENEIPLRGKLISIMAIRTKESFESKIANLFWNSYVPEAYLTAGGYIYG